MSYPGLHIDMALLRNLCFTINNYTVSDFDNCEKLRNLCDFMVIGFEIGDSGTPHIQGYAELTKRTKFNTISKVISRAHIEARKGTQKQATDYCKKDGNWLTWGEPAKQGARGDLHRVKVLALDEGMRGVSAQVDNLQAIRVAEKFLTYNEPSRDWKPTVIWIWGPTGTGKSRVARNLCGDDVYTKNTGTKWWDGYDGHEYVIVDDFRDSWWSITYMLALLDRYEFQVEIKGGQRQMRAKQIIITSAFPPNRCYLGTGEAIDQLLRRIDIIECAVPEVPEVGGVIVVPPDMM